MNKYKRCVIVILLLLAGSLSVAAAAQTEQRALAEKLVRLHVVANSDSAEDQNIKLQVRDAVLAVTEPLSSCSADPRRALRDAIPEIRTAAEACLQELGSSYDVTVTMGPERFPTRYYDSFALPAGVYPALRVVIGSGDGQNWWCVAFPSICLRATSAELEQAAVSAGFTGEEISLITEEGGYVLKFKVWELLGELKAKLFA